MSIICGEPHPEDPAVLCDERPGNHAWHSGINPKDPASSYQSWPNSAYVVPPRKADAATGATLARLAREIAAARGVG